jgi:hypothetical protein
MPAVRLNRRASHWSTSAAMAPMGERHNVPRVDASVARQFSTADRHCPASLAGCSAASQACLAQVQPSEDLRRAVRAGLWPPGGRPCCSPRRIGHTRPPAAGRIRRIYPAVATADSSLVPPVTLMIWPAGAEQCPGSDDNRWVLSPVLTSERTEIIDCLRTVNCSTTGRPCGDGAMYAGGRA